MHRLSGVDRVANAAQKLVSSRRASTELLIPSVPEILLLLDTTPLRTFLDSICFATSALDKRVSEGHAATADLSEIVKSGQVDAQEQREKLYTALWAADRGQTERIQMLQGQLQELQATVGGFTARAGALETISAGLEDRMIQLDRSVRAATESDELKTALQEYLQAELFELRSKVDANEEWLASMKTDFDKKVDHLRALAGDMEESVIADLQAELYGDHLDFEGRFQDGDQMTDSQARSPTPDTDLPPFARSPRSSILSSPSPPPRPRSSLSADHRPQSAYSEAGGGGGGRGAGGTPVARTMSSASIPSPAAGAASPSFCVRGRSAGGLKRSSTKAMRDNVEAVREALVDDLEKVRSDLRANIADQEKALKSQLDSAKEEFRTAAKGLRLDLGGALAQINQMDVGLLEGNMGRLRNQVSAIEGDLAAMKKTMLQLRDSATGRQGLAAGVGHCVSCYAARSPSPEPQVAHTFDGRVRYMEHQVLAATDLPETARQRAASASGGCSARPKTACGLPAAPLVGTGASPSIPVIASKGGQRPEAALGPFDLHMQRSGKDRRGELVVMRSAGGSYQRPTTPQRLAGGAKTHRELVLSRAEQLQADYDAMQRAALVYEGAHDS